MGRLLVTCLIVAWSLPVYAAWPEGEVVPFGLMIGNNHGGESVVKLRYAHRDVEKIRDVFLELGDLNEKRLRVLLEEDSQDISAAMDEIERAVEKAKAAGMTVMLVFYYSGHAKEGRLLVNDTRLPMTRIKEWLKRSPADIRVAFFDACQSGEITRMKGGRLAPSMVELEHTKGQIIVTSSSASEGSQESDDIGGSFFTHYLTSGLRGAADQSGDGAVSLREVYEYAYNQTVNRTASTRGGTQHPTYGYEVAGHGEIVLTRIAALSCSITFPEGLAGDFLVYDLKKRRVVAEVTKNAGDHQSIAVPPGFFAIKKRRQNDLLLGEFALKAGQRLTVTEEKLKAVAFEEDTTKGLVAIVDKTRWISYSLRMGAETFFDTPTREDLFYSSAQVGLQVEFIGLFSRHMSLAVDLLMGGGSDETTVEMEGYSQTIPADFFRLQVGAALHFRLDWTWFGLYAGPRLTFLIATRTLGEPMKHWPAQTFSTVSPGITLGAALHLGSFDLFVEGRVHYLYYNIGNDASLGFGGAYLGVAYRH